MQYFFLDTSCLVKRYVAEPGSEAIAAITQSDQDNAIFLCDAAGPELVAALTRRARGQAGRRWILLAAAEQEGLAILNPGG